MDSHVTVKSPDKKGLFELTVVQKTSRLQHYSLNPVHCLNSVRSP